MFSEKQRNELEYSELEETYKKIGHDMPDYLKEYYGKKKNDSDESEKV